MKSPPTHQQFQLTEEPARLVHMGTHTETKGEHKKTYCDLHVIARVGNEHLAYFHPALCGALFERDPTQPDILEQGRLDHVRFKKLKPLKWDHKVVGATAKIDFGIDATSQITLLPCSASRFSIECVNGGSVRIGFVLRCLPNQIESGKLYSQVGSDITMTLKPPEARAEKDEP